MAICKIDAKFDWIKCEIKALESDPEGLCILHSQNIDKDIDNFTNAVETKFDKKDYDFRRVVFPLHVSFKGRKFFKDADFSEANFLFGADFSEAVFDCNVYFYNSKFSGHSNFSSSTFSGEVNFIGTEFLGKVVFYKTSFLNLIDFSEVSLSKNCFVIFQSIILPGENVLLMRDFRYLKTTDQGTIQFKDMSLNQFRFKGTDLRCVKFHNVGWHQYHGRQAVYDEMLLKTGTQPTKDEYNEVERLYRYLKLNYEVEGDFKKAGDFHYGEMEMHRRASKWWWFPFYWYNLYSWLSGYGERPLQALIWLIVFLIGLPGLAWLLDVKFTQKDTVANFWDIFLYIFENATFQRPDWLETDHSGKLLTNISRIIIPSQAALFLIALRNRLGRRR